MSDEITQDNRMKSEAFVSADVDEFDDDEEALLREAEEIQLKAAGRLKNPGQEAAEDAQEGNTKPSASLTSGGEALQDATFLILSEEDLHVAFREAQALYDAIDKTDKAGNDPALQDDISRCIKYMDLCAEALRRLQIFSKNEQLPDMDPSAIPYLLTHYYAGKLEFKVVGQGPSGSARLQAVNAGTTLLEAFLETSKQAGALDDHDLAALAVFQRQQDQQEAGGGMGSVLPPQMSREMKMDRFRRARQAKQRLEEINSRLQKAGDNADAQADLGREKIEVALDCAVKDALDELDSAVKEKEILEHMAKMKLEFTPASAPIPPPKPGKGITVTRIDQNMLSTRETIQAQVFRPSWRQPTMSIEEFAEIEMRDAIEREKRAKENREANPEILDLKQLHEQGLEDNEELLDKATEKDRNWDDWKDDNPKGRGVTKRF